MKSYFESREFCPRQKICSVASRGFVPFYKECPFMESTIFMGRKMLVECKIFPDINPEVLKGADWEKITSLKEKTDKHDEGKHDEGKESPAKHDMKKGLHWYVIGGFYPALNEVVKAWSVNIWSGKYEKGSWVKCNPEDLLDAAVRHLHMAFLEEKDTEDDCLHLAKAAGNILAALTIKLSGDK